MREVFMQNSLQWWLVRLPYPQEVPQSISQIKFIVFNLQMSKINSFN